jgi:hypothetical protein
VKIERIALNATQMFAQLMQRYKKIGTLLWYLKIRIIFEKLFVLPLKTNVFSKLRRFWPNLGRFVVIEDDMIDKQGGI